jgi:2-oxoglutarate/2-oxoacid ferredoxin oxidoreductase subunit alpha
MDNILEAKNTVTILFAGDSGDGIQLTGSQFTATNALFGNDVSTFPNFPAEIRAPQGTLAGVSGFQLNFGSEKIFTPGDVSDVLVVMNAAALKANINKLKKNGVIIANIDGFDSKNLRLAKYNDNENPLTDKSLENYRVIQIDVTKLTRNALVDSGMGTKEIDRSKNMFVLGFLYWMYNRDLNHTIQFIEAKFKNKQNLIDANVKVLKAGYHYGDTSETFTSRYDLKPASLNPGTYRSIVGNQATAIGLAAIAEISGLHLFYGTYPITPASDILHELAKHKNFNIKTFQAEDEIAAICSAIGASFGGSLGVTASSGPGIALKGEAMGLAIMMELPLLIINVQRGGPSTGLPTKTEQADLMQALYGRNGEAQLPVIAAYSPSDCFETIIQAAKIAIEHMTPVIFLSDGYIANGAEPWKFPQVEELPTIKPRFAKKHNNPDAAYLPYKRDQNLVRDWAIPGTPDIQHRVGGLEKEDETGNVSYDPENHEKMVRIRAEKIEKIADFIPLQSFEEGDEHADVVVLGWGSTFGAIKTAVRQLNSEGHHVAHLHIKYLNPFPKNLGDLLKKCKKVLIPEINDKQLYHVIRSKYYINAVPLTKIKGMPYTTAEIKEKVKELLS